MKLVILSIGDETFSVPVDSVQLLNKEIEKIPAKIKFEGEVVPVLQHPFIEKTIADTMHQQSEQTISVLNAQITTLQQKLESIKSEVATLVNHLNAD